MSTIAFRFDCPRDDACPAAVLVLYELRHDGRHERTLSGDAEGTGPACTAGHRFTPAEVAELVHDAEWSLARYFERLDAEAEPDDAEGYL